MSTLAINKQILLSFEGKFMSGDIRIKDEEGMHLFKVTDLLNFLTSLSHFAHQLN